MGYWYYFLGDLDYAEEFFTYEFDICIIKNKKQHIKNYFHANIF